MNTKFPVMPLHQDYMEIRSAGLRSKESAKFGMVRKKADGTPRAHQGIDLAIPPGYRTYAVDSGTVAFVENSASGYGKQVCIKLDTGLYVFYAHLSRVDVAAGQRVEPGQQIGLTGCTGNAAGMDTVAKGSHLHFEVRTIAKPGLGLVGRLDPLDYIVLTEDTIQA